MKKHFACTIMALFFFAGAPLASAEELKILDNKTYEHKKDEHGNDDHTDVSCTSVQLVCRSLTDLHVDVDQSVPHPCTTMDGDAGAWVCPDVESLSGDGGNQPSPPASRLISIRDVMGQ